MIRDLCTHPPEGNPQSDVCVVGAGAAGITLAVLLSSAGQTVTLLEGGGIGVDSSNDTLDAHVTGLPYRGVQQGRAHTMGGTTTMWGGQILPLSRIDFERRPWISGSGWPLRKADLEPWYARAIEVEGLTKALPLDDAVWARLKLSPPAFARLQAYFSRWCPEPNFAKLHAAALAGDRVQVWTNARAVGLDRHNDEVRGVITRAENGAEYSFRARNIIFSLGTIESNRFFLQPRHGRPAWNDSGLLGRHFQDHIDCDAATLLPRDPAAVRRYFDAVHLHGFKYMPKLRLSAHEQRCLHLLNVGATIYARPEHDDAAAARSLARDLLRRNLAAVSPARIGNALRHAPAVLRGALRYTVSRRGSLPARKPLTLRVHCEQEPCSRSYIDLAAGQDRYGMQRARVSWHVADSEVATIRAFTRIAAKSLENIAHVQPHPDLFLRNDAFVQQCQDSFHHMGGMRMDPSPSRGVVDTDLRLHGTRNCYVCSAAVFPTSGFSNPTHTLLALAARLAHHLAGVPDAC